MLPDQEETVEARIETKLMSIGRNIQGSLALAGVSAAALLLGGCASISYSEPGAPPASVIVCHKGKKTLELPEPAARGHLAHGDTPGPCS